MDLSPELRQLLDRYNCDTKAILKDHADLSYMYALSSMRENLLDWYEFDPEAALLQIGSDYGALTGLFSRRVKEVTVLDPDQGNLSVNRMRHESQGNIRYVKGSLLDGEWLAGEGNVSAGTGYDYVVLAGSVTEPAGECISRAKAQLKPQGRLMVAVCSRLGLKYWAGAKPEAVCLTKKEIEALFEGEDGTLEFYYPMPDYRLPVTVYSQSLLPSVGELTHALLAYDYPKYLRFDLGKMYDEVCRGGAFEDLANSFLFIWSSHEKC